MRIPVTVYKTFFSKPGVGMPVNFSKFLAKDTSLAFQGKSKYAVEADLGTTALQIEDILKQNFSDAKKQVDMVFADLKTVDYIQNRYKSAVSIHAKILRGANKGRIDSFESAKNFVLDGIGSRIVSKSLKPLNGKEITQMIDDLKINDKFLTSEQKVLLKKYIYGRKLTPEQQAEAFPLYEKFARPLIEKRSQPVVDNLLLSITKNRMLKEGLTIEEIKTRNLLTDDLIKRLQTEKIEPLEITLVNNYRGFNGLPEFSNRQIQAIRKATENRVVVRSRPDLADYNKFPNQGYTGDEIKDFALKRSGYRTAQANVIHSNGMLGELQFRGEYTNRFAEYEHIAYDLRQGKNTLGELFDDFKTAVSKLSDAEYDKYNVYLEKCYNYYNRLELGLPAVKPKLPKDFDKILSDDSLRNLHDINDAMLRNQNKDFKAHFVTIA